jgi:RES domain-containing protein
VEAVAYRQANYGNPLRTEPARQGARYSSGDEATPTQYLCLHPLGPFAELMRAHDLRAPEQLQHVRARTWALRLHVADLPEIAFDNAKDFGIDPAALVGDDQSACRELGTRLRDDVPGIVVPSAALPGTQNLVLFGARVGSPYLLPRAGAVDVPASITAEGGRPLSPLVGRVRFRGTKHAELVAWLRSEPFEFEEPDWSVARSP